jgi:hypothetical protein
MGGQACVFYGAAEFSRDLDLLILGDPANLHRLSAALEHLDAHNIAVPPLEPDLLGRGHAVHFRCHREDVADLRIDLMSRLRGVDDFEELWSRRTTIEVDRDPVDLLAIEDLVRAKKTQRDKDWPMIRRLVEQSYFTAAEPHTREQVEFWLRELRTPELLVRVAAAQRSSALASQRPAVAAALTAGVEEVEQALDAEEREERLRDREYWAPLKREIEALRRARVGSDPPTA